MCFHTIHKNIAIDRPEKLNWSENGVQDLLCESNYIDVDNQIQADNNDLNIIHLNIRGITSKVTELKYLIEHSLQGLSVPFACVGSGDPVRVLHLYTMNTLDTL